MTTNRVLALTIGACFAGAAATQAPFYTEVTATHLPSGLAGPCMDAAAGDADGDGDLDLALAMEFRPNVLLLNDGAGGFADASEQLPRAAHDSEDSAFADVDGDGDLDLVFVSEDDRTDELYINDGTSRFTDASMQLATDDVSNALAVLDLNGDGAPDLLTGNIGIDRVLINDGRGRFRDETTSLWSQTGESRTQDLELADVDSDGDLDVVVANEGQNQLFLNEDGRLVDATRGRLPIREGETREIRAADFDGDGDPDLAVANVRFVSEGSPQDFLLLNDGTGVFTDAESGSLPEGGRSNFTVQAVDLDRDGDVDILAPSTVFGQSEVEFLLVLNGGSERTTIARVQDLRFDDVDNDGDLDAIVSNRGETHTIRNDDGRLVEADTERLRLLDGEAADAVDVDGDGNADLSVASLGVLADMEPGSLPEGQRAAFVVQVVDLDRDGGADIIIPSMRYTRSVGDYLVLLNDGSGHFSAAAPGAILPASADGNGFDIEVADFDGDGHTDLFLCNRASIADSPEAESTSGGRQRLLLGGSPDRE